MKALSFDSTCSNRSRAAPSASVDETSRAAMRRDRSVRLSSRTSARFMSVLLPRRLRLLGHPRRAPTELLQLCHDAVEICDLRGNGFEVGGRKIEPFKQGEPAGDFVGNLHRVLLGKIATVIVRRQRQDSPHRPLGSSATNEILKCSGEGKNSAHRWQRAGYLGKSRGGGFALGKDAELGQSVKARAED